MDRRLRLIGVGFVIALSLLATLLLTPPEGSLSVDEIMSNPSEYNGDTIHARGIVSNGTFDSTSGIFMLSGVEYNLTVQIGSAQLSPAFSEGKTILVTGELSLIGEQWRIHAEEIQVGCPSKYEAEGGSVAK